MHDFTRKYIFLKNLGDSYHTLKGVMFLVKYILTRYYIIMENISQESKVILNQEIDHPKHYASKSGRDVIDWCEDFGLM